MESIPEYNEKAQEHDYQQVHNEHELPPEHLQHVNYGTRFRTFYRRTTAHGIPNWLMSRGLITVLSTCYLFKKIQQPSVTGTVT